MRERHPELNPSAENTEDEVKILSDQDVTSDFGGESENEEIGLDSEAFSRGEIDVAEQVRRTTKAMDHVSGRGEKKASPL